MLSDILILIFLIISWVLGLSVGNTMWFKNTKIYFYFQNKIKILVEKNLLFFLILIFFNICFMLFFNFHFLHWFFRSVFY